MKKAAFACSGYRWRDTGGDAKAGTKMAANISGNRGSKPSELISASRSAANANMKTSDSNREREHAGRMLKRAQRQHARAAKLVEKWQARIADLDRAGIAAVQPRLWSNESDTIISPTPLGSEA